MTNEITNAVLLQHMQAMKQELNQKMDRGFAIIETRLAVVEEKLEDVRQDTHMLKEDMSVIAGTLMKHDRKLARL